MRHGLLVAAALCAAFSTAAAQQMEHMRFELRPFASWYVPAGAQGDDFKSAPMYGLQAGIELSNSFHVLASGSWMDGKTKIPAFTTDQVTMWQYDLGVEVNALHEMPAAWLFRPFAGAGGGARSYNYDQLGISTSTCSMGYVALGTEFQKSAVALRLESRGFVSCFKQPYTGESLNRSDVTFSFGLAYHLN
jgi:hypothetical protein